MINDAEENKTKRNLMGPVLAALFAAFISVAAFFHIPLPGGVPIVLQDMLSLLSGLLLGPLWGTLAVFVFLILGAIGLPVYSGKAGIMILISGPTGGFLIGYLLGAFFSGIFLRLVLYPGKSYKSLYKWGMCSLGGVLGEVILFVS